jgi:DNA-binding transcriptional LysR family regulator
MRITLRQLEHALALNEHGSFHRAAQAVHISQPALSRSIRNLELAVGSELFDRSGPRVKATTFGEAVLRRAADIVGQTQELGRELSLPQTAETDHLRIAMGPYPAELLAVEALGTLVRRHPGVRCTASVASWRQVGELVLNEAADLGIADLTGLRGDDRLEVERVTQLDLLFFCRPDHPLLERRSLNVGDLESYPLAFPRLPPGFEAYRPLDPIVDEATGDLLPYLDVNDSATARAVVAASDALGAATPVQIETAVRSGELRVLPFRAPWLAVELGFVRLRGRPISPAAAAYMQIVREIEPILTRRNQALADEFVAPNRADADGAARTRDRAPLSAP